MMTLNAVLTAIMLSVIVEALVEYGSTIFAMVEEKAYKKAVKQVCAIAIGITFCLAAGVDFFGEVGLTFALPMLGTILTGIFISRGANYVSDFIRKLQSLSGVATTNEYMQTIIEPDYGNEDDILDIFPEG